MLIAPLDANTLAKIANGLCDNLLTCVVRAWHPNKQIFFAPAMNAAMWENPITHQHRRTLRDFFHFRVYFILHFILYYSLFIHKMYIFE